eukprot:TRINITY_DN2836_c1_g2_i2.p1 TRINITY_DN2836_c1_g2~~TRINITY_DN2836_c1_g2_i2.p1  ORF type:complete len:1297 (+),score=271.84 TRINITY_DN2836_c1_g2_i2:114-4004(+)
MELGWSRGLASRQKSASLGRSTRSLPELRPVTSSSALGGTAFLLNLPAEKAPAAQSPSAASTKEHFFVGGPFRNTHDGSFGTSSLRRLPGKTSENIEKHLEHHSIGKRRQCAVVKRDLVSDQRLSEDVSFFGSKGVEGFKSFLLARYGSLVAGWRVLDHDKNGRLSFYEFCNMCRKLGYHGNMRKLWSELDKNQNGFITLCEIDAEVGHYMGKFKVALLKKYGDMLTAWRKCIDTNGSFRIEEREVEAALKRLGLVEELDYKKLFRMLLSAPAAKGKGLGLTLAEFDPDAWNRWLSGDVDGINSGANTEFLDGVSKEEVPDELLEKPEAGGARRWRQELANRDQKALKETRAKEDKLRLGLHTVEGFKAALVTRCGSLLSAWKEALDLDGNERLTFGEFTLALHRLGFHGSVTGLWKEFGQTETGSLRFKDLDPETDAMLIEFRAKILEKYPNMLIAWVKGFDMKSTGIVNESTFVKACEGIGYADAATLFKRIQPDSHRSFITIRDFDLKSFHCLSRGDYRMLSEQEPDNKRPLDKTFAERNFEGFFYQIRRAWEMSRREEFAKACNMVHPGAHLMDTEEEFLERCKRKHGSIIGAWRGCLDSDQNGKLTFNEFCNACRRLGYQGSFKALWAQLDKDKKGWVALKDLDPESEEVVGTFLMMLAGRYGTLEIAWRKGFNKDPHEGISEAELTEACKALQFPHSAKKLFKLLLPEPGRKLLTMWDIDPICTRKQQRCEPAFIYKPKAPTSHPGRRATAFEMDDLPSEADATLNVSAAETSSPKQAPSEAGVTSAKGSMMASNSSFRTSGMSKVETVSLNANLSDIEHLQSLLKQRFHSTLAAWRVGLDREMTNAVSFGKLNVVLQEAGYHGNLKSLWRSLTAGGARTHIAFRDIDPAAQDLVDNFREALLSKCGSLPAAWHKCFARGLPRVDEPTFIATCEKFGTNAKVAKKLFRMLLSRHSQRSLVLEDFQSLLVGLSREKRLLAWHGAKKDAADEANDFGEPPASPKENVVKLVTDYHAPDLLIRSVAELKAKIVLQFGSIFSGWRKLLDRDGNGLITERDFATACQHLGVKTATRLWVELEGADRGHVRLRNFDAETWEAFSAFEKLCIEKHGSTKAAWKKVFDPKNQKMGLTLPRFTRACKTLGYPEKPDKLYKLLRPEPTRTELCYDDLWPNVNPNDFEHVDEVAFHKSPLGSPRRASSAASMSLLRGSTASSRVASPQGASKDAPLHDADADADDDGASSQGAPASEASSRSRSRSSRQVGACGQRRHRLYHRVCSSLPRRRRWTSGRRRR